MRIFPTIVASGFVRPAVWATVAVFVLALRASAFEGRINVALTENGQTNTLLYTIASGHMRIEVTGNSDKSGAGWPKPVDIFERQSGAFLLLFPHNRSFVRLKTIPESDAAGMPGLPGMPMAPAGLPPGIGPQAGVAPGVLGTPALQPGGLPAGNELQPIPSTPTGSGAPMPAPTMPPMPTMPALPQMPGGLPAGIGPQASSVRGTITARPPMMAPIMDQKPELKATGQTTNILGFLCRKFELKQPGETAEIWATDQLPAFQPYLSTQPERLAAYLLKDQWSGLVSNHKLFPLLASLRFDSGGEHVRFEVTSVSKDKIAEPSEALFQPPSNYREVRPLPF